MAEQKEPDSEFSDDSIASLEEPNPRASEITEIVSAVLERRLHGELVVDRAIIDAHPGLCPELAEELRVLQRIDDAVRDARRAGAIGDVSPAGISGVKGGESGLMCNVGDEPIRITIEGYYIERVINHGGQATVFQAVQAATGRKVAVKVIHGGSLASSDRRARFEREIEILATLHHPNVVSIIDRGRTSDGSFFFAMELVEGLTLDEYCRPKAEEDLPAVLQVFVAIATAVEEAHRHGVVHRDLKPSNIRIDARGEPHILDFGLARLLEADEFDAGAPLTITGQVVGSLPWASPEQAQGLHRQIDARSDVYSLGVMLYQTLAGRFPYEIGGTLRQVQDVICQTPPKSFSTMATPPLGPVDHSLEVIVLRALEKDPALRYQAAADLALDLRNYSSGTTVQAVVARPPKKNRPLLIGLAVVPLLLLGTFLLFNRFFSGLPKHSNSIRMEFVLIPAGEFDMGSPSWEVGREPEELQHHVRLSRPFWLAVTEVTNGQYFRVMGRIPGNPRFADPDGPVQGISHPEAIAFCEALGKLDGCYYTLPTDAQWEYAARAGTKRHVFGDTDNLDASAWYEDNSSKSPHPVGKKRPNAWGLYDMLGNAREWCIDGPSDYTAQSVTDPKGPMDGPWRVVRGGSWSNPAQFCRAAHRSNVATGHPIVDGGFRVVRIEKP